MTKAGTGLLDQISEGAHRPEHAHELLVLFRKLNTYQK